MKQTRVILLAAVVLAISGVIAGLSFFAKPTDYAANTEKSPIEVAVAAGESGTSIAQTLKRQGVILNSQRFVQLALSDKRALSILPGNHLIDRHIPIKMALAQLLDPKRNSSLLTVVEGSTLSDILQSLIKAGIARDHTKLLPPEQFPGMDRRKTGIEGFLFPATYSFGKGTTTSVALQAMMDQFQRESSTINLKQGFGAYPAYDVLKIASLIQIEADPADYQKVARVIYNRLAINMPLQLNSSVQYGLNLRGRIALSRRQTQYPSPFNTYLHTGLPPTPISNPGRQAVSAALHPDSGDWLYFITVKPHDTRFTKSFAEFQIWVTLYNKNLANGLFR